MKIKGIPIGKRPSKDERAKARRQLEERELPLERFFREELEAAWLRGWTAFSVDGPHAGLAPMGSEIKQMAADYAKRVVGGSTKPGRPGP